MIQEFGESKPNKKLTSDLVSREQIWETQLLEVARSNGFARFYSVNRGERGSRTYAYSIFKIIDLKYEICRTQLKTQLKRISPEPPENFFLFLQTVQHRDQR